MAAVGAASVHFITAEARAVTFLAAVAETQAPTLRQRLASIHRNITATHIFAGFLLVIEAFIIKVLITTYTAFLESNGLFFAIRIQFRLL